MARVVYHTLALVALAAALPSSLFKRQCQYPPADLALPDASNACGDKETFVMRINDCDNPLNGQFVTTSSDSNSSLIIDPNTPWGPTEFSAEEDPNSHIATTGNGTPPDTGLSGRAMTSTVNYNADPNALENMFGYMALHAEGQGDNGVEWQQAFTSVGDYSGDGSDGVYFVWAGNSKCDANFVRFTYTDGDGLTKIGAACESVLDQIPGPVVGAQFEAVYTCQRQQD